jgi:uncharacterized membrane protein
MTKRMVLALLALCGLLLATYLALHDLGYIGTLACGTGSCELVQTSRWSRFLGIHVAVWGVIYYAAVFAAAMVSVQPQYGDDPRLSTVLVALTGWGVLFSGWLTYAELFLIHAICRWCVGSASIIVVLFAIALLDFRTQGRRETVG